MHHDFDRMLVDPAETLDSVIENLSPLANEVTIQAEKYEAPDWTLSNPEMLEAVPHLNGRGLSFKLSGDVVRVHEYDGKLDIVGVFGLRHGNYESGSAAFYKAQERAVTLAQCVVKYARQNNLKIELGEVLPEWYEPVFKRLKALGYEIGAHIFAAY